MRIHRRAVVAAACIAAGLVQAAALAQECSPPTQVVLSDLSGEQVQPKIVATSDGGAFVSWFDNSAGGYDVRLQRVDGRWNEAFADNGMLIADRSFSSTQDYGLAVDRTSSAVLAFRDDRFGGTRITVQRVTSSGDTPWGTDGRQFANGTDFVAAPEVAGTQSGDIVVGWTNESELRFQRLDAAGNVLWANDVIISDPNASLSLCDVKAASTGGGVSGDVIVSWVRSASFNSPKHLYAQRIDSNGSFVWGDHVAVFDGGSLQFGNFPPHSVDLFGGAVFAWYNTSGSLQCLVQRVDGDGNEMFPHNGVPVSIDGSQERVAPSLAFDLYGDEIYVFWMEQRNAQSERGVYGQRIDGSGARLWGDHGIVVRPVSGSTDFRSINATFSGNAMVSFIESSGFGNDQVRAAGLDDDGNLSWTMPIVNVTEPGRERSRLATSRLVGPGEAMMVWQDGGTGTADIYGHKIRTATGLLGISPLDLTITGTCPGVMRFRVSGCTPEGRVAMVYARGGGAFVIPNGNPCAGLQLCVNATVRLRATIFANGVGVAIANAEVPNNACASGVVVQAIDVSTCTTSRAEPMP